ncbi:MAG: VTC domain-containing protein [Prolixibacteraceae bacterium]|nr:VTC domain-containing protein [Prolixibacteraceae bacterium]
MQSGYTELNSNRYERKFVAPGLTRWQAEAVVKQNSAFFVSLFQPRQVNNIYFDTPGLDCFFDNLFGNGLRWKTRIRWYGKIFGKATLPILEFKIKKGLTGTKKSFPLPGFEINREQFDVSVLQSIFLQAGLPKEIEEKLKLLQPVLLNAYQRSYFQSLDRKFRITVDDQLVYFGLRPTWNQFRFTFSENLRTVVELKYDQEWNPEAEKITNQFPFRLDKNSKFVTGLHHFKNEIAI